MGLINKINTEINQQEGDLSEVTLQLMLENLGSPVGELRDRCIYSGWCKLFNENRITLIQKNYILAYLFDKKTLFYHIGNVGEDSVFTRSFTSLLLVLLLEDHYKHKWMSEYDERRVIEDTIHYMELECDTRGYVEEKGWAHAFAHSADLLETISHSKLFRHEDLKRFLRVIQRALLEMEDLHYEEAGRLAKAAVFVVSQYQEEVLMWIKTITESLRNKEKYSVNWKNFLMMLLYSLKYEKLLNHEIQDTIEDYLAYHYSIFQCF